MSTLPLFPEKVEKNVSGIYLIRCLANGKVYVGQSSNVQKRIADHRKHLNNGDHKNSIIQASWDKYGSSCFVFRLIEETNDLDDREGYWMAELRCREGGFNIRPAGGSARGEEHPSSLLTRDQVTEARLRTRGGEMASQIADEFGVHHHTLYCAVVGITWGHLDEPPVDLRWNKGERHRDAKLSEKDVVFIRRAMRSGEHNTVSLANLFGVSRHTIANAAAGRKWAHVTEPTFKIGSKNQKVYRGESAPNAKLSREDVLSLRRRVRRGESLLVIWSSYPASKVSVYGAAKGRTWKHLNDLEAPVS